MFISVSKTHSKHVQQHPHFSPYLANLPSPTHGPHSLRNPAEPDHSPSRPVPHTFLSNRRSRVQILPGAPAISGTPQTTDAASPWTQNNSALTGHREYLVRAVDAAGNEEANLAQMVAIDLTAGVRDERPNQPAILGARAVADGEVEIEVAYDRTGEAGVAATVRLYANDGEGGAMDWDTPVGTANLTAGVNVQTVTIESSGLSGELTYLLGVRARTAATVEDANTTTPSLTTDATAPGASTLAATAV